MADLPDEQEYRSRIFEDRRPWGRFRSFPHREASSIKIITVDPGGILSLQYHERRSELWIVLDEGLEVTVGDRVWKPGRQEEIFIPVGTPHRMRGVGDRPARILELWLGPSEESDIIRLEDSYGRT
jgi:mannose-6-phosphate isomerase